MHSHVYVYKFVYFIWILGYIILAYICIQYDCGSLNSICLNCGSLIWAVCSCLIDPSGSICVSQDSVGCPKSQQNWCKSYITWVSGFYFPDGWPFRLNFQGQATSRLLHCAEGRSSQRGRDEEQQNEEHVLYRKIPVGVRSVKVMSDDAGGDDEDDDAFHMT